MHTVLNGAFNQAELYTTILRTAGYHVLQANSGCEALRLVQEASPQLVILDVVLPDADGLEICRRIKANPSSINIMVLLVSALPVPWFDKVIGMEGGADAYLTEPFEPEELVAWVKSLLRLSDREAQNRELLASVQSREKLLQVTFEQAGETILLCESNGMIVQASRKAQQLAGQTVVGKLFDEAFPLQVDFGGRVRLFIDIAPGDFCSAQSTTDAGKTPEVSFTRPDGGRVHALLSCGCVPTLAAPRTVVTLTDITARKQAEEQLRSFAAELEERVRQRTDALEQANARILRELAERKNLQAQLQHAEKMESIGLLAGGIAHDFNNILNIIKSYTALLEEHRCNGKEVREICKIFYDAVESGSSTVEQLLTLASRTELDLKPVNLNEVVEHLVRLVGRTFQNGIEITLESGSDIPSVLADRNHISQALLNLCVNARDAMPSGGRLTLRTGVITGQQLREGHFEAEEGYYVFVQVEDTGEGIDESIRGRIFEPFFTTKGSGKGTGLGLSMVYGIVKNHNGFIDVESELQRGTKFRIYLPVRNADAGRELEQTVPA